MRLGLTAALSVVIALGGVSPATADSAATSSVSPLGSDTWLDVDGDRQPDHVTLSDLGHATRVRVRTAAGVEATTRVAYDNNQGGQPLAERLIGAAPVDGRRGVELVLFGALGDCGHFAVVTWRRNSLTTLPAPRSRSWGVCFLGSAPIGEGYTRRLRRGRVQLVRFQGTSARGKVLLRRTVFNRRGDRWVRRSSSRRRVASRDTYKLWGLAFAWVASSPQPVLGDINGDRVVGCRDQAILTGDWGTASRRSDLNRDGVVNVQDLSILVGRWTGPPKCAAAAEAMSLRAHGGDSSRVPRGVTYLMRRDPLGYAYGYRFSRKGRHVRFAWSYTAGAPGCFRGRVVKKVARGTHESLYPDETIRSRRSYRLQVRGRRWFVDGERYRVVPSTAPVASFLDSVYDRCRASWRAA